MGGCWREEGEVEEEQGGNWRKVEYGDGNREEYHGWRKE